ncbi:FHA domain-containing protein [Dasania sp. GY-MA-18]|uniref:FHA domain-containing protein n=1 Tax=Dasania phycosphaerae TaxID=2950436 RepID=A0A9J6RPM4_9GAMM|nr:MULTISPECIES: FHA domain-containing protein [Dasania]MCR8923823.1 FHA domain-containing protein [Dasania sp. GY-MA-18]MCZ0866257.1 FHA domain-containing protein [Dasania phycosphaerae]MCZ0869981.1 FHA domain-containing protein [Dasania phycosphaerae]
MEKIIIKNGNNFHQFVTDKALSIGRGFDNDIISNDPHIGNKQLSISSNPEKPGSWLITVNDQTNPVLINKRPVSSPSFVAYSGDDIVVGRSHFTLYSPDHAVAPTRAFTFTNWLHSHKLKPLLSIGLVALVFALSVVFDALASFTEINWKALISNNIFAIILITVWAACWSLVGKLQRQHHHFFSHLFFAAGVLGLSLLWESLNEYVIYFSPSYFINEFLPWLMAIVCLGLAIAFSLNLSSNTSRFLMKGMLTSFAIIGVFFIIAVFDKQEFSNNPEFVVTLKPPFAPKSSTVAAKEHVSSYQQLFEKLESLATQ